MAIRDEDYSSGVQGGSVSGAWVDQGYITPMTWKWKLYGVHWHDEVETRTWLGDFESEKEISGIATFFANNPHFEHMEIFEGEIFKYAVMRIVGGRRD